MLATMTSFDLVVISLGCFTSSYYFLCRLVVDVWLWWLLVAGPKYTYLTIYPLAQLPFCRSLGGVLAENFALEKNTGEKFGASKNVWSSEVPV